MKVSDIITLECDRTEKEKRNVIHLIKEGGNWYRAHDWSAWLFVTFFQTEDSQNPLRVTAKKMKDGYIDAWIGFPATSMDKYIPRDESVQFTPIDDNVIDISISIPNDLMEAEVDDVRKVVDEWKNTLPLTEEKKQRNEDRNIQREAPRIMRISDIISSLISYPIEEKSPLEAYEYLRQLRKQVTNLF